MYLRSNKVSKAGIINLVLTTDMLIGACIKGREKLRHDICNVLLRRQQSAKGQESQFSQLINDIAKETPKDMETVLLNAGKCFPHNPDISQLLVRYHASS